MKRNDKIQIFLNDREVEGAIMLSYFSFEKDIPVDQAETEQDYHRILVYVNSMDLIKRIEQNIGLWKSVTSIKFDQNLATFGYAGYDKYDALVIAKVIPISSLCEVNIFANLTDEVIAKQAKLKRSLSKKQAEALK